MPKRAAFTSIKTLSFVQIFLMISTTFAFAFILGQTLPSVSAKEVIITKPGQPPTSIDDTTEGFRIMTGQGWTVQSNTASSGAANLAQQAPAALAIPSLAARAAPVGSTTSYIANAGNLYEIPTAGGQVFQATAVDVVTRGSTTQYIFKDAAGKPLTLKPGEVPSNFLTNFKEVTPAATTSAAANPTTGCLFLSSLCAGGGVGYLLAGIQHAAWAAAIAQGVGALLGLSTHNRQSLTIAATAGTATYDIITAARGLGWIGKGTFVAKNALGFGVLVGVAVLIATYKKESQKLVTFQCLPWEPKLGGDKCEQCNSDPLRPCSEYRCKALGQACQLLNPNTDKAQCAWVSKGDVSSPTIQEWAQALRPTALQYTPNAALRPSARGVSIISTQTDDHCLPAFTNLRFGILTNEPAQCKIDYNRSVSFDAMQYYFGDSNFYEYNHTQQMRLPAPDSNDTDLAPLLQNDGTFSLFVRCRDANGNVNADEYSINFCVSKGPDTTPPIIEGTSIDDGSPVRFGADTVPIEVYTNEPSECRWSINDQDYKDMTNTLNCATNAAQVNADLQYTCSGNLSVANNDAKEFFFRCKDQPGADETQRNEMRESYKLTLRGTQELTLISAGPNSTTIQASTTTVPVDLFAQTEDGADSGNSTCYFSPTGASGSFVEFFETGNIAHKQTLNLGSGNYTYYFRCVDAGGNSVNTSVQFGVGVDKDAPLVTRAYRRSTDALQITTNEDAQCFYSKTSCNYNIADGLPFNYADEQSQRVHVAEWKARTPYYIKCRDKYGNQPSPNSCSIVLSGVDLSSKAVLH